MAVRVGAMMFADTQLVIAKDGMKLRAIGTILFQCLAAYSAMNCFLSPHHA
jgi:hypothetical protein